MTEKRFIYIKLGDRDEIQDYIIDNNQNNHFKYKEYHFNNINDFEDLFNILNNLVAENEQLKQFIQSLAEQSVNGKVMLRDGKVYDLNKILKKGDVE